MKFFSRHFTMMTIAIIAALMLFATCASVMSSAPRRSGDELDRFIREVSNYLNKQVPRGNRVAVVAADRNLPNLSEYVIDGIMENAVNDRVFTVVDRAQLDAIRSELEFQTSGEVSDETVQSMGRMLGANTVVTVVSSRMGNQYRFRIRALSVESAEILGMMNRNVASNETINALVRMSSTTAAATSTSQRTQTTQAATQTSQRTQTTSTTQTTTPSSTNRMSNQATTSSTNQTTRPAQPAQADPNDPLATVRIAGINWMRRNLNVATANSWCYDNDPANCDRYGRLYTWNAAMSACAALGDGWRLASDGDWSALIAVAGGPPDGRSLGNDAGVKLRARSGWRGQYNTIPNTDDFGFAALPGGSNRYDPTHRDYQFRGVGEYGHWWSATERPRDREAAHRIFSDAARRSMSIGDGADKRNGFSVRCVKD